MEQFTVKQLKEYLACLPDDIKVYVGYGDSVKPARYLDTFNGNLVIHSSLYGEDAAEYNLMVLMKLSKHAK